MYNLELNTAKGNQIYLLFISLLGTSIHPVAVKSDECILLWM